MGHDRLHILTLYATVVFLVLSFMTMDYKVRHLKGTIEFDHHVVSAASYPGKRYPNCVDLKYDYPNIKRMVCWKLEISY